MGVRVPIYNTPAKCITIADPNATNGAALGINLFYNGKLLNPQDILNIFAPSSITKLGAGSSAPAPVPYGDLTTDIVTEGANLYFTDERAIAALTGPLLQVGSRIDVLMRSQASATVNPDDGSIIRLESRVNAVQSSLTKTARNLLDDISGTTLRLESRIDTTSSFVNMALGLIAANTAAIAAIPTYDLTGTTLRLESRINALSSTVNELATTPVSGSTDPLVIYLTAQTFGN